MSAPVLPRMPFTTIVGQRQLKLALELCYVEPRLSGVLISGERGTGKSTAVRSFAAMMFGSLPVTLPINATEDRVVGGWEISELMEGKAVAKAGLLSSANGGLLYIDEVNLLDDHIVNIILDVTSTGILVVEREGRGKQEENVRFTLVGTMNPEEGALRPQLLDRFGLMVAVAGESKARRRILRCTLDLEDEGALVAGRSRDDALRTLLAEARARIEKREVTISATALRGCVKLATEFGVDGHRGELVMALAARALAARRGKARATTQHVRAVAPLALQHRRKVPGQREAVPWTKEDDLRVAEILAGG